MIKKEKLILPMLAAICILLISNSFFPLYVSAKAKTETVLGKLYEFEKGNKYEFSDSTASKSTSSDFGIFTISGNIRSISSVNDVNAYEVVDGNVLIDYSLGSKFTGESTDSWYLIDDKSKKVDKETLTENIMKGAIILQTSLDGNSWITDKVLTNVAADEEYKSNIYISKDIQQVNGCYYRVIVVYSLERIVGSSKYLFVNVDDKENMKCAEVYQFYLINSSENISNGTSATATPRKELGEVVNAGKDTGFANKDALVSKDPHYGWTIGTFFVNGYTRETKDDVSGKPIFLKNVGDKVTLWFNLKQDINKLNGNSNLKISDDKNGYDQYFQMDKTNMRHGTLIIRYTDYEGVKHDPIIYTDYLAANARTGANTKVELFEEGDYEVALDYEIVDTSGFNSYTNYRIFFTFSIRNGNCMVYPFDINSGAELSDSAMTENGFKLDMAKSRYLTIDVSRIVLVDGPNGKSEDVRFNRPAKDGDQYKDEGIYKLIVHNLFTGEETTKTIYVGSNPFLRAMSITRLSVEDLESKLAEGYTIGNDGKLIDPPVEKNVQETESIADEEENENNESIMEVSLNATEKVNDEKDEIAANAVVAEENEGDDPDNGQMGENNSFGFSILIVLAVILFLVCILFVICKKVKNQSFSKKNVKSALKDDESIEREGAE